jgi:hypothetical protein
MRAVGAEVEPAGIRILRDDAVRGADEARLVGFVVTRHGELEHIAGLALDHVLQNGTVLDVARRDRLEIARALVVSLDDIDLALVFQRQPEREGDAPDR